MQVGVFLGGRASSWISIDGRHLDFCSTWYTSWSMYKNHIGRLALDIASLFGAGFPIFPPCWKENTISGLLMNHRNGEGSSVGLVKSSWAHCALENEDVYPIEVKICKDVSSVPTSNIGHCCAPPPKKKINHKEAFISTKDWDLQCNGLWLRSVPTTARRLSFVNVELHEPSNNPLYKTLQHHALS